jgi:predicted nucleotidyltransferase
MVDHDFRYVADRLNEWASRCKFVECVYFFGSRVRGDHQPTSDVDISVEPDCSGENLAAWSDWKSNPGFGGLQDELPGKLHLA